VTIDRAKPVQELYDEVAGYDLVLVPDPLTTTLGLVLVALGVGLWVWDLAQ
jgi:hypothetical protein